MKELAHELSEIIVRYINDGLVEPDIEVILHPNGTTIKDKEGNVIFCDKH